jgi:hypothetical protein
MRLLAVVLLGVSSFSSWAHEPLRPSEIFTSSRPSLKKQCPPAPAADVKEAIRSFDLSSHNLRAYLEERRSRRARSRRMQEIQNNARKVLNFLEQHDPKSCLENGWEQYENLCYLISNLENLYLHNNTLEVRGSDGLTFHRQIRRDNKLSSSWEIRKNDSILGRIDSHPTVKREGDIFGTVVFDYWYTEKSQIEYFSHRVSETTLAARSFTIEGRELNLLDRRGPCQGEASKPETIYRLALDRSKQRNFDPNESSYNRASLSVQGEAVLEGVHRGALNLYDAAMNIPAGLQATWHILSNKQVESEHPSAVECPDEKLKPKKCLGMRDLLLAHFGDKFDEVYAVCTSKHQKSPLRLEMSELIAIDLCITRRFSEKIGAAAWNGIKSCAASADNASRCLANVAVMSGGLTASVYGSTILAASSLRGTTLFATLAQSGKISTGTAAALSKLTRVSTGATAITVDFAVNPLPLDPRSWARLNLEDLRHLQTDLPFIKEAYGSSPAGLREFRRFEERLNEHLKVKVTATGRGHSKTPHLAEFDHFALSTAGAAKTAKRMEIDGPKGSDSEVLKVEIEGHEFYFRPIGRDNSQTTRNTLLGSELAEAMGKPHLVPQTQLARILVDGEELVGTLSKSAEGIQGVYVPRSFTPHPKALEEARVFSFITHNTDLHQANFAIRSDGYFEFFDQSRAFAPGMPIDTGLASAPKRSFGLGYQLPRSIRGSTADSLHKAREYVVRASHLSEAERRSMLERVDRVLRLPRIRADDILEMEAQTRSFRPDMTRVNFLRNVEKDVGSLARSKLAHLETAFAEIKKVEQIPNSPNMLLVTTNNGSLENARHILNEYVGTMVGAKPLRSATEGRGVVGMEAADASRGWSYGMDAASGRKFLDTWRVAGHTRNTLRIDVSNVPDDEILRHIQGMAEAPLHR